MISKFIFLIKESIFSLWRARLPALGSVFTIALALILFGGAYIILSNFDRATRRLQSQYRIDVFFDPLLTNSEAFGLYQNLKDIGGIASTEFVSKERAALIFKREFGEDVVQVLGTNPLPAGAIVHVARGYRTARRINRIADEIGTIESVTDVAYRGELVRILENYVRSALYGGIAFGFLTVLGAIFLVSNTIKLSIYAKRHAIETLFLLGASRRFVHFPFIFEGALQGIIGSVFASVVMLTMLDMVNYILEQFVLYRIIRPPYLVTFMLIVGVVLGVLGSGRSIGRFLRPQMGVN